MRCKVPHTRAETRGGAPRQRVRMLRFQTGCPDDARRAGLFSRDRRRGPARRTPAGSGCIDQAPAARPQAPRGRAAVQVDEERARRLYVSNDPADHAVNYDFERGHPPADGRRKRATPRPAAE